MQLTLFHSDEILDDEYTLMDVAYITAWNAVSIYEVATHESVIMYAEYCETYHTLTHVLIPSRP